MQLRSGKALSRMSRPPIYNVNPQNISQSVTYNPTMSAVEDPVFSILVRMTAQVVSMTPLTMIPLQGDTPPPQSGNSINNHAIMRPLFGFSTPPPGRDYPYGMPTSMMANLQPNMSTFSDNVMAIMPLYNPHNASVSTINNMIRPGGINYIPSNTPSLNITFIIAMGQQMDESNLELVNSFT